MKLKNDDHENQNCNSYFVQTSQHFSTLVVNQILQKKLAKDRKDLKWKI